MTFTILLHLLDIVTSYIQHPARTLQQDIHLNLVAAINVLLMIISRQRPQIRTTLPMTMTITPTCIAQSLRGFMLCAALGMQATGGSDPYSKIPHGILNLPIIEVTRRRTPSGPMAMKAAPSSTSTWFTISPMLSSTLNQSTQYE